MSTLNSYEKQAKKELEANLVSIAHRILKLKGKEDVIKMHEEVVLLYESLSVLKFLNQRLELDNPSITHSSLIGQEINLNDQSSDLQPERVTEKIKNLVTEMPESRQSSIDTNKNTQEENTLYHHHHLEDVTEGFEETPVFEPVTSSSISDVLDDKYVKKSLNDTLKVGELKIGLNDRIAFVKHLFENNTEDYNQIIKQLNAFTKYDDAKMFINDSLKPKYNNVLKMNS